MEILLVGFGSCGQNHLRSILKILPSSTIDIVSRYTRIQRSLNVRSTYKCLDELDQLFYNIIVIANRTSMHIQSLNMILAKFDYDYCLVEKPLAIEARTLNKIESFNSFHVIYQKKGAVIFKKLKFIVKRLILSQRSIDYFLLEISIKKTKMRLQELINEYGSSERMVIKHFMIHYIEMCYDIFGGKIDIVGNTLSFKNIKGVYTTIEGDLSLKTATCENILIRVGGGASRNLKGTIKSGKSIIVIDSQDMVAYCRSGKYLEKRAYIDSVDRGYDNLWSQLAVGDLNTITSLGTDAIEIERSIENWLTR